MLLRIDPGQHRAVAVGVAEERAVLLPFDFRLRVRLLLLVVISHDTRERPDGRLLEQGACRFQLELIVGVDGGQLAVLTVKELGAAL